MMRLGDNTVPYHSDFRLVMITKLPNPEYAPEVQVSRRPQSLTSCVDHDAPRKLKRRREDS